MKIIFSGLESSGKSLRIAMEVIEIAYRNSKWYKQQLEHYENGLLSEKPEPRPIISNLQFSEKFYTFCTTELLIPIHYWENLDDLIQYEQADIIIDEVGNYFDARLWQDLSLDVRRWLTQGAKSGIEIYGTAQDFAQIDKAFRRLVNNLYEITKVVGSPRPSNTKPPIKRIWGVCMFKELDPRSYNEDDKKAVKSSFFQIPSFFFIERKYCEIFDTTQKIQRSKPAKYKHEERFCSDENCTFHKVVHI